ncbi:MoxR family ATPase [Dolichospermum sp. UHCC 0315A]|uniref:AAA family ATPase n=1 Tax=Dolichospermum sp. UHCC 0315A TaxID=1914871 RepID=UPI001FEF4180|nr:MoxR family ATPase [Dolichospermum sp. UHCC 0315A]
MSNIPLRYEGKKLTLKPEEVSENRRKLYPYIPNPEVIEAVNLAIYLERPLLLKGEPGCGKTRLAQAVAHELQLPYEAWYVKSNSRARDGLYIYDAISRLRDAQLVNSGRIMKPEDVERVQDPAAYVKLQPLGRAFTNDQKTVVLIDEIDKADIDFPNDLLLELDDLRFVIEETGEEVTAKTPPIVFITSNDEKELPDAFLRRCLFQYVEFPSEKRLIEIINAHFNNPPQKLVNAAINRFIDLRREMDKYKRDAGKKASTSELIDWFRVLNSYPEDEVLAKLKGQLPYPGVLLKSWDDHLRFLKKNDSRE